jgi:hypothetical protein
VAPCYIGGVGSLLLPYLVTAAVALALLVLAWRRPHAGRIAYAVLFLAAGAFNAVTAARTPQVYVTGFGPRAFPPMREFIERVVALAPDAFVLAIAAGQVLVAAGLAWGRGIPLAAAVAGGASFLAGISWLGVGAAFPANLVLAAGILLLLRRQRPSRGLTPGTPARTEPR